MLPVHQQWHGFRDCLSPRKEEPYVTLPQQGSGRSLSGPAERNDVATKQGSEKEALQVQNMLVIRLDQRFLKWKGGLLRGAPDSFRGRK